MFSSLHVQPGVHPPVTRLIIQQDARWLQVPWLIHGFTTRIGGFSTAYNASGKEELNLGFTVADDRDNVQKNRRLLVEELLPGNLEGTELTALTQIHSAIVHRIDSTLTAVDPGDGMVTATAGILLAIQTADCVPVLIVDTAKHAIGAFHAGWRGTVQRIVEKGVARMHAEFGSQPEQMLALVGPAIGACCYAIGKDLREQFVAEFGYSAELFNEESGVLRLDLAEANRRQLLSSGLGDSQVNRVGGCTSCRPDLYFSHRQSQGNTGRMMSVIGIRPALPC